ncbi:MAG: flavin reductase family protein [Chloroflexota bacterium]|nr:flavin reductase family protein [Chloroflexota bacterium]
MIFEPDLYRAVLGRFASGVTAVATVYEGDFHGTTVSAFSAVSIDPPLIMICINNDSDINTLISRSGIFSVNILSEKQVGISKTLAQKNLNSNQSSKLEGIKYSLGENGCPIFDDTLAFLECDVYEDIIAGDHRIYIGEVGRGGLSDKMDKPLIHFEGKYSSI